MFRKVLGLKISSEIHKERALKISCHCDLVLTTASYYSFFKPLAQNSGALRSPKAGLENRSQRRSQTLCARQEAARRKRPPILGNYPHVRPGTHWERIFRKREISHCRHFARIPALPAGISIAYLPPALAHPQLCLAGIVPRKGTLFSLPLLIPIGARASCRRGSGARGAFYRPQVRSFPPKQHPT